MEPTVDILLVEDQVRYQRLIAAAIEDALPAKVRFAASGDEALRILTAGEPPDLVLLDLELPGASGEDVLARARADARLRSMPVIILTGQSGFETQMRLLEAGADDFIEKGDSPAILLARLKAQLRHKIAADRLERLAVERDLFAAGVLSDIVNVKWTILSACRQVKDRVAADPVAAATDALEQLARLESVASKLGAYAADVIQSVRETNRQPSLAPQDVARVFEWVAEVLGTDAAGARVSLQLSAPTPLGAVLADKSFLRLALLNVAQYLLGAKPRGEDGLTLIATQTTRQDPHGRVQLVTRLVDPTLALDDAALARVFRPSLSEASLGLSLAAKVMAKMGGEAWAEREGDAGGVAFCLALPRA